MQAIILAGGFGTRLQAVIPDLPKSLAPIQQRPFLFYLLRYLQIQGITHVIFALHHMADKIIAYLQTLPTDLSFTYICEQEPMGTGGAIRNALSFYKDNKPVFVLNGDTFVKLDYRAMYRVHQQTRLTVALSEMDNCERYGRILVDNDRVIAMREKGDASCGWINAGVYLLDPQIFADFPLRKFSFEQDFLPAYITSEQVKAFLVRDYFIDIGIPEDYAKCSSAHCNWF